MDQVIGDLNPFQSGPKGLRLQHIGLPDFAAGLLQLPRSLGMPRQRPHPLPFLTKPPAEQAADVPGCASDSDHAAQLPEEKKISRISRR